MKNHFTVHVVDDDPFVLYVTTKLLKENYAVETFTTGESFLAQSGCQKPDMVLLDYRMPGMDGLTVCRQFLSPPENQGIPVIFFSSTNNIDIRLACYEAGAVDFIQKPFDPRELTQKIRRFCQLIEHVKTAQP